MLGDKHTNLSSRWLGPSCGVATDRDAAVAGRTVEHRADPAWSAQPVEDALNELDVHLADESRCHVDNAVERAVAQSQSGLPCLDRVVAQLTEHGLHGRDGGVSG